MEKKKNYNLKNKHPAKTSLRVIHKLIMPTCPRKLVTVPFKLPIQNIFTFGEKKERNLPGLVAHDSELGR